MTTLAACGGDEGAGDGVVEGLGAALGGLPEGLGVVGKGIHG